MYEMYKLSNEVIIGMEQVQSTVDKSIKDHYQQGINKQFLKRFRRFMQETFNLYMTYLSLLPDILFSKKNHYFKVGLLSVTLKYFKQRFRQRMLLGYTQNLTILVELATSKIVSSSDLMAEKRLCSNIYLLLVTYISFYFKNAYLNTSSALVLMFFLLNYTHELIFEQVLTHKKPHNPGPVFNKDLRSSFVLRFENFLT